MAAIPVCPNFRKHTCERNDPVILSDDGDHWQFGCRTCRCGYVLTKPVGKDRARYELEMKRRKELAMTARDRVTFFAPRKGWAA
jgi:hypothetical protein